MGIEPVNSLTGWPSQSKNPNPPGPSGNPLREAYEVLRSQEGVIAKQLEALQTKLDLVRQAASAIHALTPSEPEPDAAGMPMEGYVMKNPQT